MFITAYQKSLKGPSQATDKSFLDSKFQIWTLAVKRQLLDCRLQC